MNNKLTRYNDDDLFSGSWLKTFFDLPFLNNSNVLKTNIRKEGNTYFYDVAIPGYSKDDVSINYENGYLIVEAKVSEEHNNSNNKYVRQERYFGSCSRSFYIGEVDEKQIKAKYDNGVVSISFKEESINKETKIKTIEIE